MGGRISIGQVRPKRRVRDAPRGIPRETFTAPSFDEDELFTVNPSARRQTMHEDVYIDRGAMQDHAN